MVGWQFPELDRNLLCSETMSGLAWTGRQPGNISALGTDTGKFVLNFFGVFVFFVSYSWLSVFRDPV